MPLAEHWAPCAVGGADSAVAHAEGMNEVDLIALLLRLLLCITATRCAQ
jgi:hypothetical protein